MATKLKNNSPDPTKYHADPNHMNGTMIPVSDKDGNPVGFDPNKPQRVVIDPEFKDSVEIDMASFAGIRNTFNSEAMKLNNLTSVEDLSDFYKKVSLQQQETPKPQAAAVSEDFEELLPVEVAEQTEEFIQHSLEQEQKFAEDLLTRVNNKTDVVFHSGYQDLGPSFASLLKQLNQQGAAIKALLAKETPVTTEKTERKPAVADTKVETNIEFLTDKPQRPQFEAYFEMEKMGTMAARYHAVVPGQDCLALIYDTRFEDGFQYLPPNLGQEKITVSVPKLSNNSYICSSLGLHWSLGCLDVVILIKHGE